MSGVISVFPTALFVSEQYEPTPDELAALIGQPWEPNRAGNKTSSDTYVLENDALARLREFLQQQICHYAYQVLGLDEALDVYITQSWVNVNPAGSSHHPHSHPNSVISGVFFIQGEPCPLILHREATLFGSLSLRAPASNDFNATRWNVVNRPGHAVLFPSTLRHEVAQNTSATDRYSLSFNSFVRGTLGSRRKLTELVV
ncbi:MAG: TIGR02466 family protein [Luteimonas sp.]